MSSAAPLNTGLTHALAPERVRPLALTATNSPPTPAAVLGRVNAAVRLIGFGTIPLGAAVGGLVGEALDLRPTMVACVVLSIPSVALVGRRAVLRIRTTPEPEPLRV
ncbi:hypothetical protein [Petropleomorpha daqingensis]|uniref:Transmembrane secretion effector n=1 Tax=Petropleomorpha daqingensis TaxID=2026353 RepID=A0A853CLR6_9ACTN|nr:hypothetical protein [Petropleomorpha daqingensis]NYJ08517.1 hypothetical protein [Petropleomorpha daqingensis]